MTGGMEGVGVGVDGDTGVGVTVLEEVTGGVGVGSSEEVPGSTSEEPVGSLVEFGSSPEESMEEINSELLEAGKEEFTFTLLPFPQAHAPIAVKRKRSSAVNLLRFVCFMIVTVLCFAKTSFLEYLRFQMDRHFRVLLNGREVLHFFEKCATLMGIQLIIPTGRQYTYYKTDLQ